MPQALHSFVGRNLPRTHLLEKFANGFRVQRSTQQSAISIQSSRLASCTRREAEPAGVCMEKVGALSGKC
jgi:hypothetical protein